MCIYEAVHSYRSLSSLAQGQKENVAKLSRLGVRPVGICVCYLFYTHRCSPSGARHPSLPTLFNRNSQAHMHTNAHTFYAFALKSLIIIIRLLISLISVNQMSKVKPECASHKYSHTSPCCTLHAVDEKDTCPHRVGL